MPRAVNRPGALTEEQFCARPGSMDDFRRYDRRGLRADSAANADCWTYQAPDRVLSCGGGGGAVLVLAQKCLMTADVFEYIANRDALGSMSNSER